MERQAIPFEPTYGLFPDAVGYYPYWESQALYLRGGEVLGAVLFLRCTSGCFNLAEVREKLLSVEDGSFAEDNKDLFSIGWDDPVSAFRERDVKDESSPRHRRPFVELQSQNALVIGVNWSNFSNGELLKFSEWLLDRYACAATDAEGYDYADSEECKEWVKRWLSK